jgi:hypothetical protein
MGRIGQALTTATLLIALHPTMDRAAIHDRAVRRFGDRGAFRYPEHRLQAAKEAGGLGLWQGTTQAPSILAGELQSTSVAVFCHNAIVLYSYRCCNYFGDPLSTISLSL